MKIPNFPYLSLTVSSLPTMVSPNFTNMFDYNYEAKRLRVVQTKDMKVVLEVPKEVISLSKDKDEIDSVREIYAKVHFSRKNVINVMNDKTDRRTQWHFVEDKDDPNKINLKIQTCY